MESIDILTQRVNDIKYSSDDDKTKLDNITSIQEEFDKAVKNLGFFNKFFNKEDKLSIQNFNDTVVNLKKTIENRANEKEKNEKEKNKKKQCESTLKMYFDNLGLTYKHVSQPTQLNVNANYYKYDDKTCSVIELGKYIKKVDLPIISYNDTTYRTYYYFDKDNTMDKMQINISDLLIETSKKTGGKPKKSRRRKNKKCRSSRRNN
jgi:hypothetical protein